MDIKTVLTNLDNTIVGKKEVLTQYERVYPTRAGFAVEGPIIAATIQYLKINIAELERIRADVASVDQ